MIDLGIIAEWSLDGVVCFISRSQIDIRQVTAGCLCSARVFTHTDIGAVVKCRRVIDRIDGQVDSTRHTRRQLEIEGAQAKEIVVGRVAQRSVDVGKHESVGRRRCGDARYIGAVKSYVNVEDRVFDGRHIEHVTRRYRRG